MKNTFVKRMAAVLITASLSMGLMAGCGSSGTGSTDTGNASSEAETETETIVADGVGGTIMWLSNLQSGAQYDAYVSYLTALCDAGGYDLTIVYGDSYNDAAGNLQAVKNGMTNDVVGIIVSQDGGIASIMEEYPDAYVIGFNTDMTSVYDDDGENAAVLDNDHFLGTITDMQYNGEDIAQTYFDLVVENGYQKVSLVTFPAYAYPQFSSAAEVFSALVEEYNETASEEIEIVGGTTVLEFSPMEDSWFLEDGHSDLDGIICLCAGTTFVFPTYVNAIANGTCSESTKLITSGYDSDESITSSIGQEDGKRIGTLMVSPPEDAAYVFALLDNAINGVQYEDYTSQRIDSPLFIIQTSEEAEKVVSESLLGTGDVSYTLLSVDDVMNLCIRNNENATYADLMDAINGCTVENLME